MGNVSAEFVYLYPPGIPIVVPGEVLSDDIIEVILEFKDLGLHVQGMEDEAAEFVYVLDEM
jgi:arginine/lysine/ornithine decarboxylase